RMRSEDTDATKSSWLPLTGPPGVAVPVAAPVSPPGAGGSSAGGFFEQAASVMMAVAIKRGRDSFIGVSLVVLGRPRSQALGLVKIVTLSRRLGSVIHRKMLRGATGPMPDRNR